MKRTKHCQKRMQQRGKSTLDVRVIQKYGEYRRGGIRMLSRRRAKVTIERLKIWLKKKQNSSLFSYRVQQIRQIINSIEKTINWMTISTDDTIITVYPADKNRQRQFMRGKCRPCC